MKIILLLPLYFRANTLAFITAMGWVIKGLKHLATLHSIEHSHPPSTLKAIGSTYILFYLFGDLGSVSW